MAVLGETLQENRRDGKRIGNEERAFLGGEAGRKSDCGLFQSFSYKWNFFLIFFFLSTKSGPHGPWTFKGHVGAIFLIYR